MAKTSITIWTVTDNRPGHYKQAEALIEGLRQFVTCQSFLLPVSGTLYKRLLASQRSASTLHQEHGKPDLLIGVGHSTHLPLLALQHRFGGRSVILMRPSLPARLFNYAMIPLHDGPRSGHRIWATEGALCNSHQNPSKSAQGVILIGGPDSRFQWAPEELWSQIQTICAATPETHWTLSTSRRTPAEFLHHAPTHPNLDYIDYSRCPPNWLAEALVSADSTWVTPDSVSMVYEALSAGCGVGVLQLALRKHNKLSRNLDRLSARGDLKRFADWNSSAPLPKPRRIYAENLRCAARLLEAEQWFGLPAPHPPLEAWLSHDAP